VELRRPGAGYIAPACGFAAGRFPGLDEALEGRRAASALAASVSAGELDFESEAREDGAAGLNRYRRILRAHSSADGGVPGGGDGGGELDVLGGENHGMSVFESGYPNPNVVDSAPTEGKSATVSLGLLRVWSGKESGQSAVEEDRSSLFDSSFLHVFSGLFPDKPELALVRTDCICPLCATNCFRPITLLSHFAVDHSETPISALQFWTALPGASNSSRVVRVCSVSHENAATEAGVECELPYDQECQLLHVNALRYPSWDRTEEEMIAALNAALATLPRCVSEETCRTSCHRCRLLGLSSSAGPLGRAKIDDSGSECSGLTVLEDDGFGTMNRFAQLPSLSRDNISFTAPLAPKPGQRRSEATVADVRRAVAEHELYHLVSHLRFKPEHIHDDDVDSEENVDDDWRLECHLDDLRSADSVAPKHKVLWELWNRFAHEKCAAGQYGERYARYSVELFALWCRTEIFRLGLRMELVGFLRALHTHGCLDAVAILSVMLCLDGYKTLEDCAASAVPKGKDCGGYRQSESSGKLAKSARSRSGKGKGKAKLKKRR
jgi:hypothetical protein